MPKESVYAGIRNKDQRYMIEELDWICQGGLPYLSSKTEGLLDKYAPGARVDITLALLRISEIAEESKALWSTIRAKRTAIARSFKGEALTPENIEARLPKLEGFRVNSVDWNNNYRNNVTIKGSLKIQDTYSSLIELLGLPIDNQWGTWIETLVRDDASNQYPESTKQTLRHIYNFFTPLRQQGFSVDIRIRSVSTKNVNLSISISDHKNDNHKESI